MSSSTLVVDATGPAGSFPQGPPSTSSSTSMVDTTEPIGSTPRGPPSMSSSTLVVDAAGPTSSSTQGAHDRRLLHPRWCTLPDLPAAPPRGPTIKIIFSISGGCCRTHRQCPPRARHQCRLQHWWWTLLNPPVVTLGGPPSTSSLTSVVDATRSIGSALQGASH
jgi:hypothetical protein